ncbi:MAG: radical SAM protein, partial [Ruminococcus sp.]|nr:radical SAM protein [Ruminococcus sp.]
NIVLCDPNLIACKDWKDLLQQLIDSRAYIDINQGIDIRLMTEEKAEIISRLKIKNIHFAWDRYGEKDVILPKLQIFKSITNWNFRKMTVFVLVNFDTTFEQDLERVYTLRDMGFNPYIMVYNKFGTERKSNIRKLQRWVNNRMIFRSVPTFNEYLKK